MSRHAKRTNSNETAVALQRSRISPSLLGERIAAATAANTAQIIPAEKSVLAINIKWFLPLLGVATMSVNPQSPGAELFTITRDDWADHVVRIEDVSNDGLVAIGRVVGGSTFYWTEDKGIVEFDLAEYSQARAVSDDGRTIVGSVGGDRGGFIWSLEEGLRSINLPDGIPNRSARVISPNGRFVAGAGGISDEVVDQRIAWIWDRENNNFEFLEGYTNVDGISNDGRVVSTLPRAILKRDLLTDPLAPIKLNLPFPPTRSTPDSRVFSTRTDPPGGRNIYEDGELIAAVEPLPYPSHTSLIINNFSDDGGLAVGNSSAMSTGFPQDMRATVWDRNHGVRELEVVLREEYGLTDLPSDGLNVANAISSDRLTVVGHTREGRTTLTPPIGEDNTPGIGWIVRLDWPLGTIRGDFNFDDLVDAQDADLLANAINASDSQRLFDLDGNGTTDIDDLNNFLERANRPNGDANFDGQVDLADYSTLCANFGQEASWSGGDFDASGIVELSDFMILADNSDGVFAATACPEPNCTITMMTGVLGVMLGIRNRSLARRRPLC